MCQMIVKHCIRHAEVLRRFICFLLIPSDPNLLSMISVSVSHAPLQRVITPALQSFRVELSSVPWFGRSEKRRFERRQRKPVVSKEIPEQRVLFVNNRAKHPETSESTRPEDGRSDHPKRNQEINAFKHILATQTTKPMFYTLFLEQPLTSSRLQWIVQFFTSRGVFISMFG